MDITIEGRKRIYGTIKVPGDKSISHRAAIIGSIASGVTEIEGFLTGHDCMDTLNCFRRLGVYIKVDGDRVIIEGGGLHLKRPSDILYAGNSGTTARLLSGILAGQAFESAIDGDESLRKRPMDRVVLPLSMMGADITAVDGRYLPMRIEGGNLKAIDYNMYLASAQVKSAILLAGLYADGPTQVVEPFKSRNHTEIMLDSFGAKLICKNNSTIIYPAEKLIGQKVIVPGDISSAAFFIVAALILPGSEIEISNVNLNETRAGIIDVLKSMGGDIKIYDEKFQSGEKSGEIVVKSSTLKGIAIGGDMIPRLIDEIPVLAVAASFAAGTTVIRDAAELKVKESNRIETVWQELSKMGACIEKLDDGLAISGVAKLKGAIVDSHNDHRIAMALAVAGLAADGETLIQNFECTDISFPGFYDMLNSVCR
ncbi:MAG: 3-phosphoshikimate 1-carboxyvinyltransferase [Thermoanaerobacteraceae bacterium]|nr:3-phosphoshikimate 1-carboxyvinyltransferase [Thermoanaerobacteraceae bacterium]